MLKNTRWQNAGASGWTELERDCEPGDYPKSFSVDLLLKTNFWNLRTVYFTKVTVMLFQKWQ